MKKLFAIFLTVLLLLNVLGYYGVFIGLKYKHTQDITAKLDADEYEVSQEITIKVPISLPYQTDQQDYKRVNGEIEHNGEFYRLVKQKLAQDTLYIICIKDSQSKEIKNALADYVKTFTDHPQDASQQSKNLPSFIKDFLPTEVFIETVEGWSTSIAYLPASAHISEVCPHIPSPPPKL